MLLSPFPPARRAQGFTLVELMVSMVVGLVLLLGMTTMFVKNTKSQAELEKSNRQTESGRYAIQLLSDDIFNAGYYSEFDPTAIDTPGALPALCDATLPSLRAAMPVPVQGLDQDASAADCLTDAKADSDVLVIRRVETCLVGVGNCEPAAAGGAFFQASLCENSTELGSGETSKHFALDTDTTLLNRHKRDCTDVSAGTLADIRRYVTHIYYVANNHNPNDGIPTLKRATLTGKGTLEFTVEPIAEGIEFLHVEYGLATGATAEPAQYTTVPADVEAWRSVVAVKLHLLSRNTEESKSYTDKKEYVMGLTAAGTPNKPTIASKHYKRHIFSTVVLVPNTAGRRTK